MQLSEHVQIHLFIVYIQMSDPVQTPPPIKILIYVYDKHGVLIYSVL